MAAILVTLSYTMLSSPVLRQVLQAFQTVVTGNCCHGITGSSASWLRLQDGMRSARAACEAMGVDPLPRLEHVAKRLHVLQAEF